MSIEELKNINMSDGGNFFIHSMNRFSEILEKMNDFAITEDVKEVRKSLEELKEMSDEFKRLDSSKLSDGEQKFCKHFTGALDKTLDLHNHVLNVLGNETSDKAGLDLLFMIVENVFLISRDLNAAKKYIEEEPIEGVTR